MGSGMGLSRSRQFGEDLYDRDGEKIGRIEEIYLDADTDEPEWALVHTGLFGSKRIFVPLRRRDRGRGPLTVLRQGDRQGRAGRSSRRAISKDEEAELYRHYGLEPGDVSRRPIGVRAGMRVMFATYLLLIVAGLDVLHDRRAHAPLMRRLREQSLSLVFLGLFLAALAGQAIAGWHDYNNLETWHAQMAGETPETLSLGRYLTTSSFAQAVTENWQSEYLQFTLFILLTVWFVQKGSPESKEPGEEGGESDEEQHRWRAPPNSPQWAKAGGWRLAVYSNSLVLVMGAIWLWSWFAQSVTGWSEYNADRLEHEQPSLSWLGYLGSADFWQTTLQNWQSEFLAVGSMAVLAIYLRQRGSPESKPVGCPHITDVRRGGRCAVDADRPPARHQVRRAEGAASARGPQGRDLRLRPDRLRAHPRRQRAPVRRLQPARPASSRTRATSPCSSRTSQTSTTRSTTPRARRGGRPTSSRRR